MALTRKIRKGWNLCYQATIGRLLQIPQQYYTKRIDADWRARLINHDFSIIAPNCCAGLIYHRLGLQFLSPTINLWIEEAHYLRFCQNLHYYLRQPLEFIVPSGTWHPIAMCGEVKIYFNHSKTVEEARSKWEERKKRVNWDNLYLIADDRCLTNKESIRAFLAIPCHNHLVFTARKYDIPCTIQLSKYCHHDKVGGWVTDENPFTGLRGYEKECDIVAWLNTKLGEN